MDYIQPTVITETGHWNLFTGKNRPQKPDALLFPLKCESLVKCDGTLWTETLNGDPTGA